MSAYRRPVALIVLDGWGLNPDPRANAVAMARHPNFDRLMARYPHTTLTASGEAVGLLPGQMGDSNVGHLNLGAGRIVYQTLVRIWRSIQDGSFYTLPVWRPVLDRAKQPGKALHLMGLVSDGGVHSHIDHLLALIDLAKRENVERVYVHAFLDGRDVPPQSALPYLERVEAKLKETGIGAIATISGRYYAMDRDKRWDRTEKAFLAITQGIGHTAGSVAEAVERAYARGETDEFVQPTVIEGVDGRVREGDGVIFFNFRPDRARQLVRALHETAFDGFKRPEGYRPVELVTMTQYDQTFTDIPVAFGPQFVDVPMGQVVAEAGLRQLRIAETEKYAHVTYFFNGGEERVFPGEERVLVPSPKVATYDLKPEMSAYEVAREAVKWIEEDRTDFIVLNFANPDMVGHTGVLEAAIRAVEAVDECLGQVVDALLAKGGAAVIIADHGNCDQMVDYETGAPHTNHTLNPVPCILVDDQRLDAKLKPGVLANVAPTLLEIIGLPKPPQMDADSLLVSNAEGA
ncbi:2,3-bisphosphoglycerate-independent phosphoglycerate mutase [Symbiobacterium thermophilum]|uniref:2,3-bisphosphoglycerate-independent phosphoglycerate mutase n=2 Tax=Symbiobacterium thermophilum TaxID=2734 RepID=GPMI_SYMTH|nr:2,3-bisphosphoglycerate-independent phosphoglycerate mutase [Symbiobacterium thermophilum]Q67SW0.1 RecName: Full=2,3-bisphosphoglycerate-independent phosphoglycerate mutase; Short=BPG-independent PGAM; Short=Phosphoglyceromutase; Short=iPGM [Symbiobacterium thermophilum IAM 14863]MBY6275198.1 2,3-bisphosphoglycerate-independent phosphoglycerate mutase [Symbiobacterium thermophilum]BAD39233.1 2,3-bisphosphoglycerate-independent phosphoglycerate mutase [Symbiobacterium thermophilum IAM 14863]